MRELEVPDPQHERARMAGQHVEARQKRHACTRGGSQPMHARTQQHIEVRDSDMHACPAASPCMQARSSASLPHSMQQTSYEQQHAG
eukprot:366006-Chlamydomonas_euryale.AAC.5